MKIPRIKLYEIILEETEKYILNEQIMLWESRSLNEIDQVLNESVWDTLSKAKDWTVGKVKMLWEKVSNFILKKSVQAMEMITHGKNSLLSGLKVINALIGKISSFCIRHKTACKIMSAAMIAIIMLSVMSVFADSAEAAVRHQGKVADQSLIDAVKGYMNQFEKSNVYDIQYNAKQMLKLLDKLSKAKGVIDIQGLEEEGAGMLRSVLGKMKDLQELDQESFKNFSALGKKINSVGEKIINTAQQVSQQASAKSNVHFGKVGSAMMGLKENSLPPGFEGFGDDEIDQTQVREEPKSLKNLKDLDRGDIFKVGKSKAFRVIGPKGKYKGAAIKPVVLHDSKGRNYYEVKPVDTNGMVGIFKHITTDKVEENSAVPHGVITKVGHQND